MIFIIILILIIVLSIIYPRLNNNGLAAYWFLFAIFVLISGFRYNVGIDTYSYTTEYKSFPTLSQLSSSFIQESNYQILWILFESAIRSITSSFYLLQILVALFVNFAVFRIAKVYSINPFLTILFYYLLFYLSLNMEILRESISISCLFIGIGLITKKQFIRYYILAIVAFLFHESGAVLFIVPFILNLKLSKKGYFIIITGLISFAGILSLYIVEKFYNFNLIFNLNKAAYFDPVSKSSGTQLFDFIKYVLMPSSIMVLFFNRFSVHEKNFVFFYIIFSILFTQLFIFYRIRDYFLILFLISVTNGIANGFSKNLNYVFVKGAFLSLFLYISLFRYYYSEKNEYQLYLNYYPYNSIINEEIPKSRIKNRNMIQVIRD